MGELAPHWDNMRKSVIAHCDQMLSMYQDTLAELGKHTGMEVASPQLENLTVNLVNADDILKYSAEIKHIKTI